MKKGSYNLGYKSSTESVSKKCDDNPINNGNIANDINSPSTSSIRLWTQILGALAVGFIQFNGGVAVGFSGVMLPSLADNSTSGLTLDQLQVSIYSSVLYASAMFGGLLNGTIIVKIGQRRIILIFMFISLLSWIAQAYANNVWILQISRAIIGFGQGLYSSSAFSFIVEISHPKYRSVLCGLVDCLRNAGILWIYIIGSTNMSWTNIVLISSVPGPIISICIFFFLKDSPRWLILKRKDDTAMNSLAFYRGKLYPVNDEYHDVKQQLSSKKYTFFNQLAGLKNRNYLKRFMIIFYIAVAGRLTGNFVIMSYATTIFLSFNVSVNPYTSAIILGIVRVASVIIYAAVSTKLNRKYILTISNFLTGLTMLLLGAYTYFEDKYAFIDTLFWIPLVLLVIFIMSSCCIVSITNLYLNEIIPNDVRSAVMSIFTCFAYAMMFVVIFVFPYMIELVGMWGSFIIFGTNNALMCVILYYILPETKDKSLEEIQEEYTKDAR